MEAVAWLAGEPHSDMPACASLVIAAYVRHLNDAMPTDQRQRLVTFLPRIVGSFDPTLEQVRAEMFAWAAIRRAVPTALLMVGMHEHAAMMTTFSGTLKEAWVLTRAFAAVATNSGSRYASVAAAALYAAAAACAATADGIITAHAADVSILVKDWDLALAVLSEALDVRA